MRKIYLIVVLLCALSVKGFGQTSIGKDFWFGFPEVSDFPKDTLLKYMVKISSLVNTSGTITISGQGFSQSFTVSPGMVTSIILPGIDVLDSTTEQLKDVAIHITALDDISVFAFALHPQRNCSMLILPTPALGSDYYVLSNKDYTAGATYDLSEFLIVSNGNTATVQITPNVATRGGQAAGVPFTVTLNSGQVYQVQAKTTGTVNTDFTGSRVTAVNGTDQFVVIGGAEFAGVGCSGTGEYLASEMMPVNTWGQEYVFVPYPQQSGDICRILASQNTTKVYINGILKSTLNAGQYYDQLITTASNICADKPVAIARFLQTAACNGNPKSSRGDPTMVVFHANNQMYVDAVSFDATHADTVRYKIPFFGTATFTNPIDTLITQIITRTADAGAMFLDGVNIGAKFTTLASNAIYCYASIGVPFGVPNASGTYTAHTITTTGQGFLAYVTGEGNVSAYSYSVGVNGKFTNNNATLPDTITVTPGQCYKVGQITQFSAGAGLIAQSQTWDFGDGGTSTLATPTHTYASGGAKTASLTMNFGCFSKTLTYTINVCPPVLPIELLDFTAKNEKSQIRLVWKTAGEINNDHFTVEHSSNGFDYIPLGDVKGLGNSANGSHYSFTDKLPMEGINYYRLKQVDFNGRSNYSNIVTVDFSVGSFYLNWLKPVPANDKISISMNTASEGNCTYSIYDMTGRKVAGGIFNGLHAGNNVNDIDIAQLEQGIYCITLEKEGGRIMTKIVKY